MSNINVHTKQSYFYVNLKYYYDEETKAGYMPGEILYDLPGDIDARNVLMYFSMEDYNKNLINDLMETATGRNDIDFFLLRGKVSSKNIKMLEQIKRRSNYTHAYITRKIKEEEVVIGVLLVVTGHAYSAKKTVPRGKYQDDTPFILYRKLVQEVKDIENFKVDIINMGYYLPREEITLGVDKICYYLPNIRTSSNPKLSQIFNYYVETGEKLVPMIDLSDEI